MDVKHLTARNCDQWDAFAAGQDTFALLQAWKWGEFKAKLGWRVFRIAALERNRIVAGAQMLVKSGPFGLGTVAYIPRGPLGDWLDSEATEPLLEEIHRVARRHRAVFLKIEPPLPSDPATARSLQKYSFRPSSRRNQPQATLHLDLTRDLDEILRGMRPKTRQYIRRAYREGLSFRAGGKDDLPAFYKIMCCTGRRRRYPIRCRAYFEHQWDALCAGNHGLLLLAFHKDRLAAARVAFCFGEHAAEFHAGSAADDHNLHANYMLVWEAIKWAKARGCRTYDLWGVPDEIAGPEMPEDQVSRTDGLWGVFRFKAGFSKQLVRYAGAYDWVYVPSMYALSAWPVFRKPVFERASVLFEALTAARR